MRKNIILAAGLLALAACNKPAPEPDPVLSFRISPVITKATDTRFESGDAIGVFINREDGAYAANAKLVYDGSVFTGELNWYTDQKPSTVLAYYPYSETATRSFSVQADQSAGIASSDFISGVNTGVTPTQEAVVIPFRHQLVRLLFNVVNKTEGSLSSVTLSGVRRTALIGEDLSAQADPADAPGSVKAHPVDDKTYEVIVPPQSAALTVEAVTAAGATLSTTLGENTLESGKKYTLNVIVEPKGLHVVAAGEIADWEDGGEITGGDQELEEHLSDGYITYQQARYTVARMKDGKWWMTQNLRFVPEGFTPSSDLTAVTAGIFCPLKINEGQTAAEFDTSEDGIAAKGYLYQAEAALGLKVGDLTTVAAAQALEGARGLCPKGWHVPTKADITALVGKGVGITTNENAPYYDGNNGSIALLNADGFQMQAFGAVTIQDNTKTSGSFMGFMSSNKDHLSSGMFCGSTFTSVSYNEKDVESSGIKNLQFCGLMPMTNKASEADYTCNGTNVSYRIAAPVRCVRDE